MKSPFNKIYDMNEEAPNPQSYALFRGEKVDWSFFINPCTERIQTKSTCSWTIVLVTLENTPILPH